jgi:hypothetical protein
VVPIENAIAKLKGATTQGGARNLEQLWTVIAEVIDTEKPSECANDFLAGCDTLIGIL